MEQKTIVTQQKHSVRTLVFTAVLAALACVATLVVRIPSPTGGYMNLGDTVVLTGAYLLGPLYGAIAGGIGSALADLISGYPLYIPATLVIKALMGFLAGALYRKQRKYFLVWSTAAELVMIVGYWLYDGWLLGSLSGSAAGILSNLVQGVLGIVASALLLTALRSSSYVRKLFPNL